MSHTTYETFGKITGQKRYQNQITSWLMYRYLSKKKIWGIKLCREYIRQILNQKLFQRLIFLFLFKISQSGSFAEPIPRKLDKTDNTNMPVFTAKMKEMKMALAALTQLTGRAYKCVVFWVTRLTPDHIDFFNFLHFFHISTPFISEPLFTVTLFIVRCLPVS